ncbi:MAG: hypothetical protein JWN80_902 [Microbacteriaceae bacterium]|nr:hypothetical protein [Microbacteriaceae bacterium]
MRQCLHAQALARPRSAVARVFGVDPLHPDAVGRYRDAIGELEVGALLSRLGDAFTVLHAVPVGDGDSDIDHVVIGPPGIFTIKTKNLAGRKVLAAGNSVLVDGQQTDFVRNSLFEARRASELIRRASGGVVNVTPLIVVVGVETVTSGAKPAAVTVLPASRLLGFLKHEPLVLRPEAVAYYLHAAQDRATWHAVANDPTDSLRIAQRFDRLRQEVTTASRRRTLWRFGGTVVAALVIVGVALGVLHTLRP